MAISKAAVVFIAAVLSVSSGKPTKDKLPTIDEKFYAQVDKANIALDTFLRLDCTDKANEGAMKDLIAQVGALKDIYQSLPASGPNEPARLKESEVFIGFIEVSSTYVGMKVKACSPDTDSGSDEDKSQVPASLYTTS